MNFVIRLIFVSHLLTTFVPRRNVLFGREIHLLPYQLTKGHFRYPFLSLTLKNLAELERAEKEIEARVTARKTAPIDTRKLVAAESIADEITRLRAEVKTLRYLFATYSAVSRPRV